MRVVDQVDRPFALWPHRNRGDHGLMAGYRGPKLERRLVAHVGDEEDDGPIGLAWADALFVVNGSAATDRYGEICVDVAKYRHSDALE
jgi:hypothetical protein